ncbi:helix-turn-helix domain-containing protein [Enterococcus sp. DIV0800]|uniref:helix-turn-helix domain-containing protein n=1 Tax=unclassified Enterococcus TaxID=2608891 RepID=UPI003D2FC0DD
MEIGKRIAELRRTQHLSQRELGDKLHLGQSTIGSWESGSRRISDEYIESLADIFNVSIDYLFGRETSNDTPDSNEFTHVVKVPILGRITASSPLNAVCDYEGGIAVQPSIVKKYGRKNLFALKIFGDSMNRIIPDGGIAIMAKTKNWKTNGIYAVLVDNQDATLKVMKRTVDGIRFEPRSYSRDFKAWEYCEDEDVVEVNVIGKFLYGIIPSNELDLNDDNLDSIYNIID